MNGREEKTSPLRPGLGLGHAFPRRRHLHPERFLLPLCCFPTSSRSRPSSTMPGAAGSKSFGARPADGPARRGRCQQGHQTLNIGAIAPAAFPVGHAAGRNPHCPVIQNQRTNAPEPIASTPL